MGHGHGHGHGIDAAQPGAQSASGQYRSRLLAALLIGASFMLLELLVGLFTSSLALLSDAAHMLTDVVGVAMALAAVTIARRAKPRPGRTFGLYRAEVLAALGNAVLLFGVAGYVIYEAIRRLAEPPLVPGVPVMLAAAAGLVANVASLLLLRKGAEESLNLRGAYLEVLADTIGSVGVLLSGAVTLLTGWAYADPIIGVAIGVWVLPRTAMLAKRALRILFQHAPHGVDVDEMTDRLTELPGVTEIHDLHVWTLTSGMEVASAHITLTADAEPAEVLAASQHVLRERYGISHATLQVEPRSAAERCQEMHW
jgi:cobalt-zinc-cadmium efflux system protein